MQIEFCRICKRRVTEIDLSMGVAIRDGDTVICHDCKIQADSDAAQVLDLFESGPREPTRSATPVRGGPGAGSGIRSGKHGRIRRRRRRSSGVRQSISSSAIPIVQAEEDMAGELAEDSVRGNTPSGGAPTERLRAHRSGRRPRRRRTRGRKDGQGRELLIGGLVMGFVLVLLLIAILRR